MRPTEPGDRKAGGPGLKARAIGYLSRREHSRLELQRKLARHCEDPEEISRVLDELQRDDWQSDQRFAESYVQRKAAGQGTARIIQALGRHHLPDEAIQDLRAQLRDTEAKRLREVWVRSEEHTSELQSLMRISYAVFCLTKKIT